MSVWTGGRFLPSVRNAALAATQIAIGGTPYLDVVRVLPVRRYATAVAWSKDGRRIAAISDFGRAVSVWRTDGSLLAEFERSGSYTDNSILFLSDDLIITPATQGTRDEEKLAFTIWNIQTRSIERNVIGPVPEKSAASNQAAHFAISQDHEIIAAINPGGAQPVTLYSTKTWEQIRRVTFYSQPSLDFANSVSFSSTGLLAVGTLKAVKLFDAASFDKEPVELIVDPEPRIQGVETVAFSPDGNFLATGSSLAIGPPVVNAGGTAIEPPEAALLHAPIKIWRVAERALVSSYTGHIAPVRQICWHPAGRFVAAAIGDGTIRIYSATNEQEIAVSQRYSSNMSVSFSPDGKLLAAATESGVALFDVPSA